MSTVYPKTSKSEVPGDRKPGAHTDQEPDWEPDLKALEKEFQDKMVVKPNHYQSQDGKFQVWDIVDQFQLNYYFGDAVKYICRAGKKKRNPATQDIRKAMQYLQRWLDIQEAK